MTPEMAVLRKLSPSLETTVRGSNIDATVVSVQLMMYSTRSGERAI